MKWVETKTAECRWADRVEKFLGKGEVIFDNANTGYQGDTQVIVAFTDGRVAMYEWSYGSCSGCDRWEDEPEAEHLKEIEDGILWFDSPAVFLEWLSGPVTFRSRSYDDTEEEVKEFKATIRKEYSKFLDNVFGPRIH